MTPSISRHFAHVAPLSTPRRLRESITRKWRREALEALKMDPAFRGWGRRRGRWRVAGGWPQSLVRPRRPIAAMVSDEPAPGRARADFSMNMPPEPEDPALIARMREGYASVAAELEFLVRYQRFGGSPADKDAASAWLGRRALVPAQDRLFATPRGACRDHRRVHTSPAGARRFAWPSAGRSPARRSSGVAPSWRTPRTTARKGTLYRLGRGSARRFNPCRNSQEAFDLTRRI